jgi:hypothetical protein
MIEFIIVGLGEDANEVRIPPRDLRVGDTLTDTAVEPPKDWRIVSTFGRCAVVVPEEEADALCA